MKAVAQLVWEEYFSYKCKSEIQHDICKSVNDFVFDETSFERKWPTIDIFRSEPWT